MLEVNLIFEVHCHRPPCGIINPISKFTDSRYRVYVDDDLITERSWIWDNGIKLLENIWLNLENNKEYKLRIDPVVALPEQAKFNIDNFKVTNSNADINKIDDLQVNFTLR